MYFAAASRSAICRRVLAASSASVGCSPAAAIVLAEAPARPHRVRPSLSTADSSKRLRRGTRARRRATRRARRPLLCWRDPVGASPRGRLEDLHRTARTSPCLSGSDIRCTDAACDSTPSGTVRVAEAAHRPPWPRRDARANASTAVTASMRRERRRRALDSTANGPISAGRGTWVDAQSDSTTVRRRTTRHDVAAYFPESNHGAGEDCSPTERVVLEDPHR